MRHCGCQAEWFDGEVARGERVRPDARSGPRLRPPKPAQGDGCAAEGDRRTAHQQAIVDPKLLEEIAHGQGTQGRTTADQGEEGGRSSDL